MPVQPSVLLLYKSCTTARAFDPSPFLPSSPSPLNPPLITDGGRYSLRISTTWALTVPVDHPSFVAMFNSMYDAVPVGSRTNAARQLWAYYSCR